MTRLTRRRFRGRRYTDPDEYFDALKTRQAGARRFQPACGAWAGEAYGLDFPDVRVVVAATKPFSISGGGDGFRRILIPLGSHVTLEGEGARLRAGAYSPVLLPRDDWRAQHEQGAGLYFSCREDALTQALALQGAQESLDDLWNARLLRPVPRLGPFTRELWDLVRRFSTDSRLAAITREEAKAARTTLLASLAQALAAPAPARRHEAHRAQLYARACAYLVSHARAPVRLQDVAAAAGCPPRTLQDVFHGETHSNVIARAAFIRMGLAYARLADPAPGDTVTSVALDCGFSHLGDFSGAYLRHYGERPSDTLARARRDPRRSIATAVKKTLVSPLLRG